MNINEDMNNFTFKQNIENYENNNNNNYNPGLKSNSNPNYNNYSSNYNQKIYPDIINNNNYNNFKDGTDIDELSNNNLNVYKNKESKKLKKKKFTKSIAKEIMNMLSSDTSLIDNISRKSSSYLLDKIGGSNDDEDNYDDYDNDYDDKIKDDEIYEDVLPIYKNNNNNNDDKDDDDDNNNLKNKKISKIINIKKKDKIEHMKSESSKQTKYENGDYTAWFFDECFNLKEFVLLFSIYFVLSQDMVKDFFAKYLTWLNPDEEGKVDLKGIMVYGLLLSVLFLIIRKFV
jgi:hypothetical protein